MRGPAERAILLASTMLQGAGHHSIHPSLAVRKLALIRAALLRLHLGRAGLHIQHRLPSDRANLLSNLNVRRRTRRHHCRALRGETHLQVALQHLTVELVRRSHLIG